ncbi:hypothetical protein B4Q13_24820, partial [Lacticaseibacillus rhamnosus]
RSGVYSRILFVPGVVALILSSMSLIFPRALLGRSALLFGLLIMTSGLIAWRSAYPWLAEQSCLQQRVYVLGTGDRACRLVRGLRLNSQLGVDVVGWSGSMTGVLSREDLARAPMRAFVLSNVRTPEECAQYIAVTNRAGYRSLEKTFPASYRSNERVVSFSRPAAAALFQR